MRLDVSWGRWLVRALQIDDQDEADTKRKTQWDSNIKAEDAAVADVVCA